MANVMPSYHGGDEGDEPPRHPPSIVLADCESTPPPKRKAPRHPPSIVLADCESTLHPKRRQHYKLLTVYHLYNKLGCPIPIQLDLDGETCYAVGEFFEHYIRLIGSLIRQLIPPCYRS